MRSPYTILSLFLVAVCSNACSNGGGSSSPTPVAADANAFNDVTVTAGLDIPFGPNPVSPNGVGATCGDYDNDGFVDLFIVRDQFLPTVLFRNRGDGTFQDVSVAAGLSIKGNTCGPCFADIDGDGFLDLLILGVLDARPRLFHNQQNGTFVEITKHSNIVVSGDSCSAAFGDYDRDGDLDVFIGRWERDKPTRKPNEHLWRNNGDMTFTDVSDESQIAKTIRVSTEGDLSFTPNFADINNDGWPDLLIAADFGTSRVFLNKQDGTFEDTTNAVISDDNGMGAAVGDYDNDGDLDWFVTSIWHEDPQKNWSGNRLYRNRGDGTFEDTTDLAGVRYGFWGWGASFADFNHDGHLDIVHVNGWVLGFEKDPSRLYLSNGDGTFAESATDYGFLDGGQGRAVICFDYDNDGDLDVFIHKLAEPWRLLRNDLDTGNHLIVKLRGAAPNTEGIGAWVRVTADGKTQMREIRCGCNFLAQNPSVAHFGLGAATEIERIRVTWPDGTETVRTGDAANQRLVITR